MTDDSPVERGDRARASYIAELSRKGVLLAQERGRHRTIYKTVSGKIVGIPHARELPEKGPNRWFLGLPGRNFDFVILLCETHEGDHLDFVLPTEFVKEVWESLSFDQKGNAKFEVLHEETDDKLVIRFGRLKSIRDFLGRSETLTE